VPLSRTSAPSYACGGAPPRCGRHAERVCVHNRRRHSWVQNTQCAHWSCQTAACRSSCTSRHRATRAQHAHQTYVHAHARTPVLLPPRPQRAPGTRACCRARRCATPSAPRGAPSRPGSCWSRARSPGGCAGCALRARAGCGRRARHNSSTVTHATHCNSHAAPPPKHTWLIRRTAMTTSSMLAPLYCSSCAAYRPVHMCKEQCKPCAHACTCAHMYA
jgi:hypothetical protein